MAQGNTTGISNGVSLPVTVSNGGTGQITKTPAFDALSPTTTKGDLIVSDGSDNIREAIGADDTVLTADAAQASGVKWAAGGGGTALWSLVTTATPSAASQVEFTSLTAGIYRVDIDSMVNSGSLDALILSTKTDGGSYGGGTDYAYGLIGIDNSSIVVATINTSSIRLSELTFWSGTTNADSDVAKDSFLNCECYMYGAADANRTLSVAFQTSYGNEDGSVVHLIGQGRSSNWKQNPQDQLNITSVKLSTENGSNLTGTVRLYKKN